MYLRCLSVENIYEMSKCIRFLLFLIKWPSGEISKSSLISFQEMLRLYSLSLCFKLLIILAIEWILSSFQLMSSSIRFGADCFDMS